MVDREKVAKIAGVSTMTVTRVVSGKGYVSEKTRKKVKEIIEKTGYIPNRLASGLASGKNSVIAIILPNLLDDYYVRVSDALTEFACDGGYAASIYKAGEKELPFVLESVISNRVTGIISFVPRVPAKYVSLAEGAGIRLVCGKSRDEEVGVELSYREATEDAIGTLFQNGAKNIVYLAGMSKASLDGEQRTDVFTEKTRSLGVNGDIVYGEFPDKDPYVVGFDGVNGLISEGREFDALMCLNDNIAIGAIEALREKGKRIPEDVMIVGCDDIPLARALTPSLSTLRLDVKELAKIYYEYVVGGSDREGETRFLKAAFVPRKSTDRKRD